MFAALLLAGIVMSIFGIAQAPSDPVAMYGPPGRYGYGYPDMKPLNTKPLPPGTLVNGVAAPWPVTFPAPRPAPPPQPVRPATAPTDELVFPLVVVLLLALSVAIGLLTRPKPPPPAAPPKPVPPGPEPFVPLNPRMYWSDRR